MYERIKDCMVECSRGGVLQVTTSKGEHVSVLPVGTHAALNFLGVETKRLIVLWWRSARV
jgi:hypothetical protein